MTLRVPFEGFASAMLRTLTVREAYVHLEGSRAIVTAGEPDQGTTIIASTTMSESEIKKSLKKEGIEVFEGLWSADDDREILELPYIAAVSYQASKIKTGVWVDAFNTEPTVQEVLHKFQQEVADSLPDSMSLEEFATEAHATVAIISPSQVSSFLS
jgi:hypothetical protein